MNSLTIAQLVIAILLSVSILIQQQGSGLGGAFGSDGNSYRSRRGIEKWIFRSTIILAILFFSLAIYAVKKNA